MSVLLPYAIGLLLAQISMNAFVVAFTPPGSFSRYVLFPFTLLSLYQIIPLALPATDRVLYAALIGAHSISFVFQYLDTALLSRWKVETGGPSVNRRSIGAGHAEVEQSRLSTGTREYGIVDRLRFGYWTAVSTRNVGTPFQIAGIPRFSSTDPAYIPSRKTFVFGKIRCILFDYLVLDAITLVSQPEQNSTNFAPSKVSWIDADNWSLEPLIIRSTSVLGFWVSLYCIIQAYMSVLALASVAIGISDIKTWPPAFGRISEAQSIRRFWG